MTIHELKRPNCDDPDLVLEGAKGLLKEVIIIGDTGKGFYFAGTTPHKPTILWLLETLKSQLMNGDYDE